MSSLGTDRAAIAIPFAKTEAHGNDFILVDESESVEAPVSQAILARSICDRLRGIGGDGLILYAVEEGGFAMTLLNSDGSPAEISGNGLRCLGAHLVHAGLTYGDSLRVRTGAGTLSLELVGREDALFRFRADMGPPRLLAKDVPFDAEPPDAPAVNVPLQVDSERFAVTAISMGNPHCVLFTDRFDVSELRRIGPRIESHPRFPRKTNVELVEILSPGEIRMGIWERGAGETASSGTGSSASAVASILNGLARSPVQVHCPGGTMIVEWARGGPVFLTGEARVVARGTFFYGGSSGT